MELRDALSQITQIRLQLARTQVYRGFRSVPVAISGVLAIVSAVVQALWIPAPLLDVPSYLMLWLTTALLSLMATALEMAYRYRQSDLTLIREMTWLTLQQFLPSLVAGGFVTAAIALQVPEGVPLLPGLWAILFSLGIFASYRLLPQPIFWVGVYYLAAGILCLVFARGPASLSPWAMGLTFGLGQFLAAGVFYWTLERDHGA